MDLSDYVDRLRDGLVAAVAGDDDDGVRETTARLAGAFDGAIRMMLLEALADATAEISAELPGGAVELRFKGRQPEFVVTPPVDRDEPEPAPPDAATPAGDHPDDEPATARLTLRLPEALKQRVDETAGRVRLSTNTWLVETIRTAVNAPDVRRRVRGRQLSGWAR